MFKKGNSCYNLIRILSTFLLCAVALFYTSVHAFAFDYVGSNDTPYKSADYFGLEELPYGEDTGVVQFQYDTGKYLTLYFDKLSIFDDVDNVVERPATYVNNHYWACYWDTSSGSLDMKFNIISDSPIYYKKSYAANQLSFQSQIGTLVDYPVYHSSEAVNGTNVLNEKIYAVYELENFSLNSLVPDWTLNSNSQYRTVYSNCYQVDERLIDGTYCYVPARAGGATVTPSNGARVGYLLSYYPTTEYLQNEVLRADLLKEWNTLVSINTTLEDAYFVLSDQLLEMYTINDYLDKLYCLTADLLSSSQITEMYIKTYIAPCITRIDGCLQRIEELLEGPEYDSSQGIGSNTEFGDSVGGLIDNTEVPDIGTNSIKNNLGNSFLFIRDLFSGITGRLNLNYVISFLLGLSFIAYVLGRVIKNKMKG